MQKINIYCFLDFRDYLKEFYHQRKSEDKKFSHRYFALKLGFKSSGYFSDLLTGKRNLNSRHILQFCKTLGLDKDESQYFESLVNFNQAVSILEKKHWLSKLFECKKIDVKTLNKDVYQYFSEWYYSAIREALFFYRFKGDYKKLADFLNPPIKPSEAKSAIVLLTRLGLIIKDTDGSYIQKEALLSTGDNVKSVEVANFQLQTLKMAIEVLNGHPSELRDFSTLTLSISDKGYEEAKRIIAKTRNDLLKVASNDTKEDRVYQVNIQLFPLTKLTT